MNRRELLKFAGLAILTSPALPLEGFAIVPPAFVPITEATLAAWARRMDPEGRIADIMELLEQTNDLLLDLSWLETSRSNVVASRGGEGSQGSPETFPERTR